MIINETYTIRIISSDNPANFITTLEILDTSICDVVHDGYNITISTKDILGETTLVVEDFEGGNVHVPIVVDNIVYSYDISYDNKIVNNDNPAIIYYNTDSTTQYLNINEHKFSTLYNRFLTDADNFLSSPFYVNCQYNHLNDGITLTHELNTLKVDLLSAYSETQVSVSITSSDNTLTVLDIPIYVIDGDLLGIFPSGNIVLDERNTTSRRLRVTGTDQPLVVTGDPVGFSYTVTDQYIDLLPLGNNASGSTLNVESFFNGNTKTNHKKIFVRGFPLQTSSQLKVLEVGIPHKFKVEQVIGDLSLEGIDETVDSFTYSVAYTRNKYLAEVTIIPTKQMVSAGKIKITDTVEGRVPRIINANVKFVVDLDLTVVTNNVMALDIPLKVRFENAEGKVKFMAVSKLTGYSIRTEIEYDINQYNQEVSTTSGHLLVYPISEDTIILRAADSRSFEDVELNAIKNPNDFSKWVAVIPTEINQQDLSNTLTSPAVYTDTRLKAGDFVGNTWIDGYKYGINQITKITYKVSPPDNIKDNAQESLNWMKNLTGTSHTLNISVRDGFILEDKGKNFTATATWLNNNVFETEDLTDQYIIIKDAETVLIADNTDRISVTNSSTNNGVIIYNENNEEIVTSRIDFEPVSFIEIYPISPAKKIPMNKPSSCYDIKRMDSSVESGEFKIFPSTSSDESIDVLCEFGTDTSGQADIWTVIPEKSIRNFAELVGNVVGDGGIELDIVSNGGIHPEFYPSALNSNDTLSYLFLELPYNIKSFGYTLDTRETDAEAAGTFKILTDTSDIFHINGTVHNNTMLTRQGSVLNYDSNIVKQNLGQIVSLPTGSESYEHIENANGGTITTIEPSNRIVIMNSGSSEPFTLSETFIKELRFKSIYNASNITTEYWIDTSSSGIDLINLVTLSVNPSGRWIVSDMNSSTIGLPENVDLQTDTTWLISNVSNEILELDEFIKIKPKEIDYNISDTKEALIDLSEFVNITPKELVYIISNTDSDVIAALSRYNIVNDKFDWNISQVEDILTQLDLNNISADLNIREIVETIYHRYNISFVKGDTINLTTNSLGLSTIREEIETDYHKFNISIIDKGLLDLNEFVKLSTVDENDEINNRIVSIIIKDISVSEIPLTLSLSANNKEIISDIDSYTFNVNEFVSLLTQEPNYVVSNNISKVIDIITRSNFDSYHPVNRLWRDAIPMDISNNASVNYLSADINEIITPLVYPVIEIIDSVNNNLTVLGHNPALPYTIFQDARKADIYSDSSSIDMRNIEYKGTETDIINQTNVGDMSEINFFNSVSIKIENDVITQTNYETSSLVDMRDLVYTGSKTDIINQYFDTNGDNKIIASAEKNEIHLLPNEIKSYFQKSYKNLDLVSVSRENWTQQDIFNKWPRIKGPEYFENGLIATGEAADWYMSGDTIIMPTNTANLNAFISPYKYSNYTLESRLYSGNVDDDTIGLVAAHNRIGADNYTLYVGRTKAGQNPKSGLGFIFSKNNAQQVITNISVDGTSGGWSGSWSKMKVVREGDIFKVWAGNWNTWSYSTSEPIMTIDLNDYPEMSMLLGAQSYGYMTWSQANTKYYDNVFIGNSGTETLVEIKDINGNWVEFIEGIEYPTLKDHIDIRSTEEIEFNLSFKEYMPTSPIDMRNLVYTGSETDIIDQVNEVSLTPINFTNLVYTGSETDIISQLNTNNVIPISESTNLVNMDFSSQPNTNIAVQYKTKSFEFDANPSIVINEQIRTNIVTQKKIGIMDMGEQVNTLRDNTYISNQKLAPKVGNLGDTLRLHIPTVYKKDTVLEAELIEFSSSNEEVVLSTIFTEDNMRETEVLDFNISGTVNEVNINTYKGTDIEAVETVSIV